MRLADPGGRAVDPARRCADVEHLRHRPKNTSAATSGARADASAPSPGAATKKSSSCVARPLGDEHVAAGAEPGELRLGDERGGHGGERRVDGVAAGAQRLRAGVSREWMACRDDALHGRARPRAAEACPGRGPQNLGMNSGTSTSIRDRLRCG